MEKTRIDKWLWAVRIFKTRTLASNNCKKGNIRINEEKVKPSYNVQIGDLVGVHKNGFNLIFRVEKVISKRVGAPLAVQCYENLTSEDELNKFSDWFIGKGRPEVREKGAGRPTKKDRRVLEDFKDGFID
ncbi:RNA-binding S4 domain-containing protein [Portibacter marinus]|uniref:RNA-binding S4 domain-containing protein n=1 Tax=Portibacter marinus TaxID=2898660 RepID=UPI001F3DB2F5|nr:S4 domain-containing protein [Portibacter marinus]